jgi:hypothetical protein
LLRALCAVCSGFKTTANHRQPLQTTANQRSAPHAMPYDPNLPQADTEIDAVQMRSQLNGLKDLIDAIPAGPPGQNGSDGTSVTGAIIDGTNTLNPGDAAQASVSWDGANVRFTFGIPRGQDGVSSPPITSFIVDGVTTLNPGDPATANASFDGSAVRLLFGIPRGSDGTNGSNGNDGGSGPQGAPGEVTTMQLNSAINGTSNNSNGVALLGLAVSDPPTQSEVQAIVSKLDELITALRR